tara:strand:+ start:61 stop:492 length:432 start_codon:yes stop_codon:yes gene_type:complete
MSGHSVSSVRGGGQPPKPGQSTELAQVEEQVRNTLMKAFASFPEVALYFVEYTRFEMMDKLLKAVEDGTMSTKDAEDALAAGGFFPGGVRDAEEDRDEFNVNDTRPLDRNLRESVSRARDRWLRAASTKAAADVVRKMRERNT